MSPSSKTTVIYVLSSPHSGSTLMGSILGSHPSVQFGGELFEIPDPAWHPDHVCTCGQTASTCPFWTRVQAEVGGVQGVADLAELQTHFQKVPGLLSLLTAGWFPSHRSRAFAEKARGVAEAVSRASGKPMVFDSSHGPGRALAYELARSSNFDVRFLHMVRDGRRVVASRKRSGMRHSPTGTIGRHAALQFALLWVGANILFTLRFGVGRRRYLRVRYEDMILDPEATLGRVGRFLELDLSENIRKVLAGQAFPLGHVLSGNRFRLAGEVKVGRSIPQDDNGLLPRERRTYRLVAGLAARLFGYS